MAPAIEAPASTAAEGPTQHTPNQTPRFSAYQLRMLHGGINKTRVQNLRGMSHLEAWDVRRQLIRIFGFGGYDVETLSLDLVAEREKKQGEKSRWTVVYRAQVRLIIKDTDGREIAHFDDGAAGDSANQPSLGDAHDMAMKTSFSQALKRCVVNLGDQFGLSLYNDGATDAVVGFSAAHPPQDWKQQPPPQPEPEDPPVRPEPGVNADEPAIGRGEGPKETPKQAEAPVAQNAAPSLDVSDAVRAGHVNRIMKQVAEAWPKKNPLVISQIKGDAEKHQVLDAEVEGPPPGRERMPLRTLLDNRFTELKAAKDAERGAA